MSHVPSFMKEEDACAKLAALASTLNFDQAAIMLAAGALVDSIEGENIFSPLYWATMYDFDHAVRLMVENGADVYFVCGEGKRYIGFGLLEPTPMTLVVLNDDVVKLTIMMESATKRERFLEYFSCMLLAKKLHSMKVFEMMQGHPLCDQALAYAIDSRILPLMHTLLHAGVRIENHIDEGQTALLLATDNNTGIVDDNLAVVDMLIKAQASVNAIRVMGNDSFTTPLYQAMMHKDLGVVRLLLSAGACTTTVCCNQGHTFSGLITACLMGNQALVEIFTEHELAAHTIIEAIPDSVYCAVLANSSEIVTYLIAHGADYQPALYSCFEYENHEMIEVIRACALTRINRRLTTMALKKHMARRRACRNMVRARLLGGCEQFSQNYNESLVSVIADHLRLLRDVASIRD